MQDLVRTSLVAANALADPTIQSLMQQKKVFLFKDSRRQIAQY